MEEIAYNRMADAAHARAKKAWRRLNVSEDARKRGGSILDCARKATTPKAAAAVRAMLGAAPDASQATRRKVEKLLTEVGL